MKKLVFATMCFSILTVMGYGQNAAGKDSAKTVIPSTGVAILPLPPPAGEKSFYLILPESNWLKILSMLEGSMAPAVDVLAAIKYIKDNTRELNPPVPDSTVKPHK